MKEYNRATREGAFADLHPELGAALRRHAAEHALGDVHAEHLICIETESERVGRHRLYGLLGSVDADARHYMAAIVTPTRLLWAITGDVRGTTAFSAHLGELEVHDYDLNAMIEDDGVIVTALARGMHEKSSAFLGLAPGDTAEKFKCVLRQAIRDINAAPQKPPTQESTL